MTQSQMLLRSSVRFCRDTFDPGTHLNGDDRMASSMEESSLLVSWTVLSKSVIEHKPVSSANGFTRVKQRSIQCELWLLSHQRESCCGTALVVLGAIVT